jgi:hypothetical protein
MNTVDAVRRLLLVTVVTTALLGATGPAAAAPAAPADAGTGQPAVLGPAAGPLADCDDTDTCSDFEVFGCEVTTIWVGVVRTVVSC